jgi:hypothetical protein
MKVNLSRAVKRATNFSAALCLVAASSPALAEVDWMSFTMDNDALVGTDNGYTNGMYFSWYDTDEDKPAEIGFLARAMAWSLPDAKPVHSTSAGTIGQTMMTPDDLELRHPPEDDLSYGGLLFYNDTFVEIYEEHADRIGVMIGVVGDYSGAEWSQKNVHEVIDSDRPAGWSEQIQDEIVFQFSRGRSWLAWRSGSRRQDVLWGVDAAVGTMSSYAGASIMYRYGSGLVGSGATSMLSAGRTSNPIAIHEGWFVFAGARPNYLANMIFYDGNTYRDMDNVDAHRVDYDHEQLSVTAGFAYGWKDISLTWAINDMNVLSESSDVDDKATDEYSEYGTFTIAWKHD